MSSRAADLLPFDGGPFALRMGVQRLDPEAWIDVDPDRLAVELDAKRELLATRPGDVVVALDDPAVRAMAAELERAVVAWWGTRGSPPPALDAGEDRLHPVVRAALRTQEDWCLLAPVQPGDRPVLVAACVCFPSRWILTEKLGLPLAAIHGPVAFYDDQLASPVDRFLERLRPDRPVWRANWNLVDDPGLCQGYVPEAGRRLDATVHDVADLVFLRVERQTLRRLPETGAVAFGIRVHQRPVRNLADRPDVAARLVAAVDELPPSSFAYKGLGAFWEPLAEWIRRSGPDRP